MNDATAHHPRLAHLAHDIERFRAFVRSRIKDTHTADEVLQDAFARAARAIDQVEDVERLDAWFYRILRNRMADLSTQKKPLETLTTDPVDTAAEHKEVCQCLLPLVERLPADVAQAVRSVDLDGKSTNEAAEEIGISVNTLNVRRHRGRQQLRELLTSACGMCASDGCRDCHCA